MLVKLGGSLITDKTRRECLDRKTLVRLCKEIHSARKKKKFDLVVGHGGGGFPHYPAHKYKVKQGIQNKDSLKGFVLTNDAAARLNRVVVKELMGAGENAVSVQPSAWLLAENGKIKKTFTGQFAQYLKNGFLPVPYGDAVLDSKRGVTIVSTEQILGELAVKLGAKRLIVVTNTKGVFTADPLKDKNAKFISLIERKAFPKFRNMLKGSHGTDVTGGMLHKVEELVELAGKGVECSIISGKEKGNLEKALLGKKAGTIIR
ncbi:MAG: isopentenyl phosphate kinase [Candidatus Diapherotrites archaeon]|nr:isopentenyl phosphate kinase [Candidatus Diapherotrites archaeon]